MISNELDIDVCVCTFRRSHIVETIRSIGRLAIRPNWVIRVIVADNDETPSARDIVEATARECSLSLTYVHAPARNISVARNACLDAATARYIAFIDDDEVADPDWMAALMATLESRDADVVLGPVQAVYRPDCPDWMRKGDFHSTRPVWVNGEIITGYTCNVLFRRLAPALSGRRFRVELGGSGGEDHEFFTSAWRAGGTIAYAATALITEPVADNRSNLRWLLRRRFRFGETHGLLLMEDQASGLGGRLTYIAAAGAKAGGCFLTACLNCVRSDRSRYWVLRGTLHVGVIRQLLRREQHVVVVPA